MPVGLGIPFGANSAGGMRVERDESRQTANIIRSSLSAGGDDNPFQSLGLDEKAIFQVKSEKLNATSELKIRAILEKFIDRISIPIGSDFIFDSSAEAEIKVSFGYVDLLTDEELEFREALIS